MRAQPYRLPRSTDEGLPPLSRPLLAWIAATILAAVVIVAGGYMLFRDDILKGLLDRQIEMQYAYEQQLAAARLQLDEAISRQTLDQSSVESKMQKLALRETLLETRAVAVAELVEHLARDAGAATSGADAAATAAVTKQTAPEALSPPARAKPQPEEWDLRLGDRAGAPAGSADHAELPNAADPRSPREARLVRLAVSLDKIERAQASGLAAVARPAIASASRLRRIFDIAGVSAERFAAPSRAARAAPAMGGPYVAAGMSAAFERDLAAARSAVGALDRLRGALASLPLRKPLDGAMRLSSGFGYRTDPFLGRPALHSGVDLLDDYGEPVRAAAGGTVIAAGPSGGYGNMVEVDHGAGYSTRYGHLSQIDVTPGQSVAPGAILGRVGSSGRSTGAHLHYEVRADGEAVDPARFLRAATELSAMRD